MLQIGVRFGHLKLLFVVDNSLDGNPTKYLYVNLAEFRHVDLECGGGAMQNWIYRA